MLDARKTVLRPVRCFSLFVASLAALAPLALPNASIAAGLGDPTLLVLPLEAGGQVGESMQAVSPALPEGLSGWQAFYDDGSGRLVDVTESASWTVHAGSGTLLAPGLVELGGPGTTILTARHAGLEVGAAIHVPGGAMPPPGGAPGDGTAGSGDEPPVAVDDAELQGKLAEIVQMLIDLGLAPAGLLEALQDTEIHEEGKNAGHVPVPDSADGATTFVPDPPGWPWKLISVTPIIVDGEVINVYVYDGNAHIVLSPEFAQDLRDGILVLTPSGELSEAAAAALHELLHVLIFFQIDAEMDPWTEEHLVAQTTSLIQRILEYLAHPDRAALRVLIKELYAQILQIPNGPALLALLGLKDSDGDGYPDIVDKYPGLDDDWVDDILKKIKEWLEALGLLPVQPLGSISGPSTPLSGGVLSGFDSHGNNDLSSEH